MRWSFFALCAAVTVAGYAISRVEEAQSRTTLTIKPLILEKNDGEHRVRRPRETPMPTAAFTIKVDSQNGGSHHLVVGTETIPPGGQIARHKHLGQDEIVLIETGSAHVWLASEERDVHAGAVVFIPSDTWIGLKNTGNENINLTFVFSAPGFEEFQRCISVPADSPALPLSREEFQACQHEGHVAFDAVAPRAGMSIPTPCSRQDITLLGVVGASAQAFGESPNESRTEIFKKQLTKIDPPSTKLCKDLAKE